MKFNFLTEHITGDRIAALCRCAALLNSGQGVYDVCAKARLVYCHMDNLRRLFFRLRQRTMPMAICTGMSDWAVDDAMLADCPPCVDRWYAVNVAVRDSRVVPVPLGCQTSHTTGYSYNMNVLAEALKRKSDRPILALLNMNVATNPEARWPVVERFAREPWVKHIPYPAPFVDIMGATRDSRFIICPPGNGLDTHRAAESIYLGAIPVVLRNLFWDTFASTTPILVVDAWEEVTRALLERTWDEFGRREWTYDHYRLTYWKKMLAQWR
jgi:hypothetical protein